MNQLKTHAGHLANLRYPTGLFAASSKNVATGYNKAWLRDNIYCALGFESTDKEGVIKTYQALLDIFLKHEYKIDFAIESKPEHAYQYIHARYNPETFEEFHEEWGNKQNDAVGAFLFKIADLTQKGFLIVRNFDDLRIIQKLVYYLHSIEYWQDQDNGMWEENEEVHASSVGACTAALLKLQETIFTISGDVLSHRIYVPFRLIDNGMRKLQEILPCESKTKEVDLALLSLIWPYKIVTEDQKRNILQKIEECLVRSKGGIRYRGDQYYNKNGEAEWTMCFPWLAIIFKNINKEKYNFYLKKSFDVMNKKGEMPELYFANSEEHNENSPLGWAQSLLLVALEEELVKEQ